MDIRLKWFYRLGFMLLLFIVFYIFMKLKPMWGPVLSVMLVVLLPFIIGAFISYLLHPVVEALHQKGVRRGLSVIIIYLLFFGGLGFGIYKGIPIMMNQVEELSENVPVVMEQYKMWMKNLEYQTSNWPIDVHERIERGMDVLAIRMNTFLNHLMNYAMKAFDFLVLIALIPFIAFYMLKDFESLKKMIWYITPKKWRKQGRAFLRDVDTSLGGYIRGQLFVCVAIGVAAALLFWLFDMKYPLLLGAIIGITNVIPYFGPIFGAVPAIIIAATLSIKMVITVAIIVLVLQFLEGNVLSPLIVGKSLHMHPLFIMLALLAGGEIGGIIGMIVSIPILAILKVFVLHARVHFRKKEPLVDK
ncbi:AI-2E family transporter [Peribacillus asahii]|uniref:AI-2E family transporter n=1 Tax=Peribacillus asahii TaxID=228899 RepID=UPI0037FAC468